MSNEFPIQTTPLDELAAGQRPLTPPAGDRRGNEHASQVFPLTGRQGVEVNNNQAARAIAPNTANGAGSRPPESVSGLNAGSGREFTAKRFDQVNVSDFGRHQVAGKVGDVAKSSLTQAAVGAGGPRAHAGQFPNGKNDSSNGAFGKDYGTKPYPTPDNGD